MVISILFEYAILKIVKITAMKNLKLCDGKLIKTEVEHLRWKVH